MLRLWAKDLLMVAAAAAAVIFAGFVARWAFPGGASIVTAGAACAAVAVVVLEVYRRLQLQVKEAAREQYDHLTKTYHQIEALMSVTNTITPSFPLPETRGWSASPDILNQLCRLILTRRPNLVFEVGSGVSTLITAHCLRRVGKGRVVSLDHDPRFAEITRQLLAAHGLSDIATIVDAPLKELTLGGQRWMWYDVDRIPPTPSIDFMFIDGPPVQTQPLARYPAIPVLAPRLAADCVVVLDDGARPDEHAIVDRWTREFGMASEYLHTEKGAFIISTAASSISRQEACLALSVMAP